MRTRHVVTLVSPLVVAALLVCGLAGFAGPAPESPASGAPALSESTLAPAH